MKSAAIAGLLLFALAQRTALADPPPQDTAYREGRAHVEAGDRAFDGGDYRRAADEYLAAYQRIPLPDLLYNLGQCYRLAGDRERAIEYYRRYLAVAPSGAAAAKARDHIARLGGSPDDAAATSAPVDSAPPPPPPVVSAPSPAPVERAAPRARWLPLGVAAAGLLAIAGGTALWISADRTHDRLERDCAPGCDESDWSGARTRERAGIATGIAGAGAVAGGLLWWGWSGSF